MFPTTGGPKPEAEWSLKSYTSGDGSVWQLSSLMQVPGQPNETTLRFLKDGSALALVRREAADKLGYIGSAIAPYREWKWSPLPIVVQGQNFIQLPDGSLIAGSRGRSATPICDCERVLRRNGRTRTSDLESLGDACVFDQPGRRELHGQAVIGL